MKKAACLVTLLAATLSAADLSGRWTGVIEIADQASGTVMQQPVRAEFQQKARAVSGRIGRPGDDRPEAIRHGRLDGKRLLFDVASPETAGDMRFDLQVEGDRLVGSMKGSLDSGPIVGKVRLTREGK